MGNNKRLESLREQDYKFSAGAEIRAAGLLFAEICRLPPEERHCYLETFITDDNGEIQVDYGILLQEVYRLAEETGNVLVGMERMAGDAETRKRIASVRAQLLKMDFALLKTEKNPGLTRFLKELYRNV